MNPEIQKHDFQREVHKAKRDLDTFCIDNDYDTLYLDLEGMGNLKALGVATDRDCAVVLSRGDEDILNRDDHNEIDRFLLKAKTPTINFKKISDPNESKVIIIIKPIIN